MNREFNNSAEDPFENDEDERVSIPVPDLDEDDLYSILTIGRTASIDEITQAYRRLSRLYHPDKHSAENKDKADILFGKIKRAYEVLSDPSKRVIYNELGMKGVENVDADGNNALITRFQTPQEILEEFERRNREREERELERKTNPRGRISVNLNATELFSPYRNRVNDEDDYYSESGPLLELTGFQFSQSIEAPLTLKDTFVMSGTVNAQNGRGDGNVSCGWRKTISDRSWGEVELGGASSGFNFGLKGFSQLNPRYYFNFNALVQTHGNVARPALVMHLGSALDPKSSGSLTWRLGNMNGLQSTYVREFTKLRMQLCIYLGIPHSYASISCCHTKDDEKYRFSGRAGTFGAYIEYGVEKKMSPVTTVAANMTVGLPLGVSLKFKVIRSNQTYIFPIQLAEEIVPSAVFYGTAAPFFAWVLVKKLFLEPFEREKLLREKEKKKMTNRSRMQTKRVEAENAILLMAETYKRIKHEEESRNGLIIVSALYGRIITTEYERAEIIDVTVPLQCIAKDSKLILHEGSKNSLPGFYDPAVGEDKNLMIKYKFHGELHEIVIRENESLKIPKQAHRVNPL